jgi:hypothetical protein
VHKGGEIVGETEKVKSQWVLANYWGRPRCLHNTRKAQAQARAIIVLRLAVLPDKP